MAPDRRKTAFATASLGRTSLFTDMSDHTSPLKVYVDYSELSASQVAVMLWSLESLYQILLPDDDAFGSYQRVTRYGTQPPPYFTYSGSPASALCIEQIHTGNSITFSFAGKGQPAGILWKGSDLEVALPSWTAAALGAGALILGSGYIYDRYLDTELKKIQTDGQRSNSRLLEAQIEKTRAETEEITDRIKRNQKPARPSGRRRQEAIERSVQSFHRVIAAPNIVHVEINAIPVLGAPTDPRDAP